MELKMEWKNRRLWRTTTEGNKAMPSRIVVLDSWPYIRRCAVCAICQAEKPVGKITCDTCRLNRTFISMTDLLIATERSLQWNAEREPDQPARPRATDPKLRPCLKCGATGAVFIKFQVPGKVVGHRLTPNIDYFVRCNSCGCQTLPRPSKRLAADMWTHPEEVFDPRTLRSDETPLP
jgi:hypothetical protein